MNIETPESLKVLKRGLEAELEDLHREAGDQPLTSKAQGRWNRIKAELRQLDQDIEEAELIAERAENTRKSRAQWGGPTISASYGDNWHGVDISRESPAALQSRAVDVIERAEDLSPQGREALGTAVESREGATAAAFVLARSNPEYLSAFHKILANPERGMFTLKPEEMHAVHQVESARAAMSTSTGSAGWLLPLSLDPNVMLANDGTANPIRANASVRQVASSPHRAVKSAGVTAEWVAEAATFADASPTFGHTDIELHKMGAFVFGSYEIIADSAADLYAVLPTLLADARDRLEADAFALGSGSGAPRGIVTALAADSKFVTATTRGSFTSASAADVLSLLNSLPPRARQAKSTAWLANNTILNVIRTQTVGTAGSLLMDLNADGNLLSHKVFEASAMTSATTSGSSMLVLADLAKYQVCDHIQGPSLEFMQNLTDPTTGRPTGQRGWVFWHRTGGDMLDTSQGRILKS